MIVLSFDVGIKNLAYCILDSDKILYWEVICVQYDIKDEICEKMINELDDRMYLLEVDIVLIEKQPSFNPQMRIVANCLQTYFTIRGIIDRPVTPIQEIILYNPKFKLKCYEGPEFIVKAKTKYSFTKKMGINHCRSLLETNKEKEEFIELFNKSKKKDDLADSYLQALSYCKFKNNENILTNNIKCRIPTKKQLKYGKFNINNIKYILTLYLDNCIIKEDNIPNSKTFNEFIEKVSEMDKILRTNIKKNSLDINNLFKSEYNNKKFKNPIKIYR